MHSITLWCFVHGKGQRVEEIENKTYNKETGEFDNQFILLKSGFYMIVEDLW